MQLKRSRNLTDKQKSLTTCDETVWSKLLGIFVRDMASGELAI